MKTILYVLSGIFATTGFIQLFCDMAARYRFLKLMGRPYAGKSVSNYERTIFLALIFFVVARFSGV